MTALCKSKACPVLCFRAEKTVKQALSTLYAKNVTEQQESALEAPVNANIAVMQFQAEILVDKINMKKLYPKALCKRWRSGEMTATAAMNEIGLKPNTFYRRVKELGL